MLKKRDILVAAALAGSVVFEVPAAAQEGQPITQMTCDELLAFYDKLPFTDILPIAEGFVEIDGQTPDLTIGFSQTGFNHPWRVSMLQALQAEACRHPNIELIVLDGNVDIAKQNNDVRDLLARGVAGGHVQVTAYGPSSETCNVEGWNSSDDDVVAQVRCFDASGNPADARYTVLVMRPEPGASRALSEGAATAGD